MASKGVVDGLTLLQDELLRRARVIEEYICNYVGAQTPRNHTCVSIHCCAHVVHVVCRPKAKNDKDVLALLDDMSRQMQKAREAAVLSLQRAEGKLRRFRNSLINLNSLPDELLLSIFNHACGRELEEKLTVIDV